MANKWVLEGNDQAPTKINMQLNPETSNLMTGLKSAGQGILGLANAATKAVTGPAELLNNINAYNDPTGRTAQMLNAPGYKPLSQNIEEGLESIGGKGSTKAGNIGSKALQYTAGNLPYLLAGGLTGPKLAADLAGSTAMALVDSDNPIIGIVADVLGKKGFSKASQLFKATKKLAPQDISKLDNYISNAYKAEESLAKGIPVKKANVEKSLKDLEKTVSAQYVGRKGFDEAAKNRVLNNIETAKKSLKKKGMTVNDLVQQKRSLNSIYSDTNSIENRFMDDIRKSFTNEIDAVGSLNPTNKKWHELYKHADELYSIDKWQSGLTHKINEYSREGLLSSLIPNPIAQAGIAALTAPFYGVKAGIAASVLPALGKGSAKAADALIRGKRFVSELSKTEDGQRLIMEIVADSAKQNSASLTKNLHKFNKKAEKFERSQPSIKGKWVLENR